MAFDHPFYFLRHGQTTWNAASWTQGQTDSPLSQTGREQARSAADALCGEPIVRIVASPLSRARHTAEAVAAALRLPVTLDPNLMEVHLGDHEGGPHGDWLAAFWREDHDPPNGETFATFRARVWSAMADAVARGPGTLIVAHGGLWRAARTYVRVDPDLEDMPNALPLAVTPSETAWSHRIVARIG